MMVNGPYITRQVVVPEHTEEVFDAGAYWNLDFDGSELGDGDPLTLLYARVAWPTLKAAQQQFRLERQAHEAETAPKPRRRQERAHK